MEAEYTPDLVGQKFFEVQSYSFDDAGNDVVETENVQGYLAVTPDFVAVTDDVGRVIFYMPADRIKKVFATGDVPAPEKPVIDLSNVVAIGPSN